jgi:molybdopterin/thiamine biosynthesis adenylyltransferase
MMYRPQIFNPSNSDDYLKLQELGNRDIHVFDEISSQLMELMLCRNPSMSNIDAESNGLVNAFLEEKDKTLENFGNWIYYPWKNQLIHVLPEDEFIEVRTNRNKYKITTEEQELLKSKVVGIAGLSVGRSIATTIALERIAGEIRLADFDTIELSNLNRIKAPISELGINKAISAAREIAEIDPYIEVICFQEGLTEGNMNEFFSGGGKVDIFVEECDDIKMKILSRLKCKELQIPVIMETNDNCIIDIERFDLEPDRPIFHGKLNDEEVKIGIRATCFSDKMALISKIIDTESISSRLNFSLLDLGKTLRNWPQLNSEITYGAGILSELIRFIFLNKTINSGQFYFDPKSDERTNRNS